MLLKSRSSSFGGTVSFYQHSSSTCHCDMTFSIYLPPQAEHQAVPVLYFLSGLTCTADNFTAKSGVQAYAAQHGIAIVAPDTSPRGEMVPDDPAWDLGQGAGFYVDATQNPWQTHYQMYSYVTQDLPQLIRSSFPVLDRAGIFGHSMGGHGALVCALRNPAQYLSVSAFAPIVAPMQCAWGQKALASYLGPDRDSWRDYDACELVQRFPFAQPILIDQGSDDSFLDQLLPEQFETACHAIGQPLLLRRQLSYDHSYYFVASFMGDHLAHHAKILNGSR